MRISFIAKTAVCLLSISLLLSACAGQAPTTATKPAGQSSGLVRSNLERSVNVQVPQTDAAALAAGNRAFAVDLYRQLSSTDGNLIFSPFSVSLAMAMVDAGARAQTLDQINTGMHFTLPSAQLHPAFNALDASLESLGVPAGTPQPTDEYNPGDDFQLNIANSLWGQADHTFLPEYLDLLAQSYGAGLQTLDFTKDPESARKIINNWVSEKTKDKIQDLFAQGTITPDTRLVLANAIYFKASWQSVFYKENTKDGPFTLMDGSQVTVPMMTSGKTANQYFKGSDYTAVALPYRGAQVEMIIILPDTGNFQNFEKGFDSAKLGEVINSLSGSAVDLTLPRFKVESSFSLNQALSSLGISAAFNPDQADFSGMDGQQDLYISQVVHKAFIQTDESGTEAAAATGIAMEASSMPVETPPQVIVDHPFLFFIYDQSSGAILFEGRVLDPSK
jgi:serpin B